MIWFFITGIALLLIIGGYIGFRYFKKQKENPNLKSYQLKSISNYKKICIGVSLLGILGLIIGTSSSIFYTQDPGQASVLVSFTGEVIGVNYETGLHIKSPWSTRVEYDIRNNTLSYVGTAGNNDSYTGGDVSGPQITFQDKNGVSGNIDINVRYSIRGNAVGDIYNEFKTQQEFVNATLAPDVRATTREILSKYETSEIYNEREKIQPKLLETLQSNWDKLNVDIEEIYLQEVRYPSNVVDSFAAAQAARADVEKAKAEQEKAKVEAETNNIKTKALSEAILKEKLIDAIKNGHGTYIIDTNNIGIAVK